MNFALLYAIFKTVWFFGVSFLVIMYPCLHWKQMSYIFIFIFNMTIPYAPFVQKRMSQISLNTDVSTRSLRLDTSIYGEVYDILFRTEGVTNFYHWYRYISAVHAIREHKRYLKLVECYVFFHRFFLDFVLFEFPNIKLVVKCCIHLPLYFLLFFEGRFSNIWKLKSQLIVTSKLLS